jgi:double-strand break repair protein MRE11
MAAADGPDSSDVMKILVTTDNHIGYGEKDGIRSQDSFTTFEEVLMIARDEKVDLILNGGDLFHDNKPSRRTMYKTIELLRRYCLNSTPVQVEYLSDPAEHFQDSFGQVNYEDENFNVGLPFFIIHGNHDDPTGSGALPGENHLSALDILAASNLINYFGKADDIDDIEVAPILLRKGCTKVALYGLGNIRDERLYHTWETKKKVKWLRPEQDKEEWFNLFTLHQNRVTHDIKKTIKPEMLPDFLDFVVWGHEHEAKAGAEESGQDGNTTIYQPGSTVATSLCEAEAKPKNVGILEIYKDNIRFVVKPLKSVRPYVFKTIVLTEELEEGKIRKVSTAFSDKIVMRYSDEALTILADKVELVQQFLEKKVDEMIEEAACGHRPDPEQTRSNPKLHLPLIRLKVELPVPGDHIQGNSIFGQRFGQKFVDKVANPQDLLLFAKPKRVAPARRDNQSLAETSARSGPARGV